MLGAGLFVGLAAASAEAGPWFLLGIPLAALTAACCAFSTADQSDAYRGPGAAYACARSKLGVIPARIVASTNLAGHLAAMAAVAGAVAGYIRPLGNPAAPLAILLVVAASTAGLRIRGRAAWWWLGITGIVLAMLVPACLTIDPAPASAIPPSDNALGITGAAGVMFFGFAGFERLTAPSDERDRHARRHVRTSLIISLVAASAVYLAVGAAYLYQLGAARLALSPVPASDALGAAAAPSLTPLVSTGAALAMIPVLLGVMESFRSTALAVVQDGDLPGALGRTGGSGTPYLLDLVGGLAAAALSVMLAPAQAIALAACCLLVHYALSNAGARVLLTGDRTWRGRAACLCVGLSVVLAMSMPVPAMLGTLVVVIAGPVLAGAVSGRWS